MQDGLAQISVVLHRPQEVVNIGAVVRAMKNMGVTDLRLVQPVSFDGEEILRVAHRCDDIVANMGIYTTLDDALADMHFVVGTAAIVHHKRPLTQDVRGLSATLIDRSATGRCALLFGQEDDGLDNAALDRCHLIAMLPSNPDYPALNLAQSVLLFLYELRMTAESPLVLQPEQTDAPATHAELEALYELSEERLHDLDFFRYNPATVMRTLRQIGYRAELSQAELKLLMAILYRTRKA